jgi:hypothetical protein
MEALCACLAKAQFATPLNGRQSWATLSRRVRLWSDVAPADQPALFVAEHGETIAYASENAPVKTILNVDLIVYVSGAKDPEAAGASDRTADPGRIGSSLPGRRTDRQGSGRSRRTGPRPSAGANIGALTHKPRTKS